MSMSSLMSLATSATSLGGVGRARSGQTCCGSSMHRQISMESLKQCLEKASHVNETPGVGLHSKLR